MRASLSLIFASLTTFSFAQSSPEEKQSASFVTNLVYTTSATISDNQLIHLSRKDLATEKNEANSPLYNKTYLVHSHAPISSNDSIAYLADMANVFLKHGINGKQNEENYPNQNQSPANSKEEVTSQGYRSGDIIVSADVPALSVE